MIDDLIKYLDKVMEKINEEWPLYSNKEKQELLRVASCFNNCITTNAILEDYNDKKN